MGGWGGGGGGGGFFFFKQKTAYEIGTGDWSSDVCSSDLGSIFGNLLNPLTNAHMQLKDQLCRFETYVVCCSMCVR